jgi:antitoxin component YwqK of YwqJK toxin-antitoxin module
MNTPKNKVTNVVTTRVLFASMNTSSNKIKICIKSLTILFITIISSSMMNGQSMFDIESFKARSQKKTSVLEDMGEKVTSNIWTDSSGATLEQWTNSKGEVYPRYLKSSYVFLVPGPANFFLRKAWLTQAGKIIEEERRAYDSKNRLICEGIIDPLTGSFSLEYKHRYSTDGKTQYTIEYKNGKQVGEETSTLIEE